MFLIDFSRFTVRAADLLERREADAELLGNSLLGQVKVLGELLQFKVLGGGHCAPQPNTSHPARARARGCPARPRRSAPSLYSRDVCLAYAKPTKAYEGTQRRHKRPRQHPRMFGSSVCTLRTVQRREVPAPIGLRAADSDVE